jgi:hypothetical protein
MTGRFQVLFVPAMLAVGAPARNRKSERQESRS